MGLIVQNIHRAPVWEGFESPALHAPKMYLCFISIRTPCSVFFAHLNIQDSSEFISKGFQTAELSSCPKGYWKRKQEEHMVLFLWDLSFSYLSLFPPFPWDLDDFQRSIRIITYIFNSKAKITAAIDIDKHILFCCMVSTSELPGQWRTNHTPVLTLQKHAQDLIISYATCETTKFWPQSNWGHTATYELTKIVGKEAVYMKITGNFLLALGRIVSDSEWDPGRLS